MVIVLFMIVRCRSSCGRMNLLKAHRFFTHSNSLIPPHNHRRNDTIFKLYDISNWSYSASTWILPGILLFCPMKKIDFDSTFSLQTRFSTDRPFLFLLSPNASQNFISLLLGNRFSRSHQSQDSSSGTFPCSPTRNPPATQNVFLLISFLSILSYCPNPDPNPRGTTMLLSACAWRFQTQFKYTPFVLHDLLISRWLNWPKP